MTQPLRILALTCALVLALVACDDAQDAAEEEAAGQDAMAEVSAAAGNVLEAGTARSVISLEQPTGEPTTTDDELQLHSEEHFDEDRRRLAMAGLPDQQDDVSGGEIIVDGTEVYVLAGAAVTEEPNGEQWLRLDLDDLDEDDSPAGPPGFLFRDSRLVLEAIYGAAGRATHVDADDEATPGERYQVSVEPASLSGDPQTWWDAIAAGGQETLELDVWVDPAADVLTRVDYFPVGRAPAEEEGSVTSDPAVSVRIEYSDLGADVAVDLPAEDDVTDLDAEDVRDMDPGTTPPAGG